MGKLETHLRSCDYTLLSCTNKCTKNRQIVKVLKKDLPNHLANKCPRRQHRCPHCREIGEHQERTTSHLVACPQVKVLCPNNRCMVSIPRCEVSTHRYTCDYEPVPCKYAKVGCEGRPLRKDLKEHEEDAPFHLQVTTEKVLQLTQVLRFAVTSPFTFKLTNFQKHKHDKDVFYSPPFYTSRTGYKMRVGVYANGNGAGNNTHISVFASLMKGDNDEFLTWPFTGEVIIEVLNQLDNNNHHKTTLTYTADNDVSKRVVDGDKAKNGWGWAKFISHADLGYQPDKNCQYLKDDMLVFGITVEVNNPHPKPWLVSTV